MKQQPKMKQNEMFQIEHRPVVKYGGKEFETIDAAKTDALMTYPGMTAQTASEIVRDSERAAAILLWQPEGQAPKKVNGSPEVTDQQISEACAATGVPYKVARIRVRRLGWTLGKSVTVPVRVRKGPLVAIPAS